MVPVETKNPTTSTNSVNPMCERRDTPCQIEKQGNNHNQFNTSSDQLLHV